MIHSVSLENFKAHRHTEMTLGPLTLLVGPNGAGKTSVLQALHLMGQLVFTPVEELLQGERAPDVLLSRGQTGPLKITTRGLYGGGDWFTSIQVTVSGRDWSARVECKRPSGAPTPTRRTRHFAFPELAADPLGAWIGSSMLYGFDARRVAAPGNSDQPMPKVEPDGANTAVALAALKLADDERFEAIVDGLRRLVPSVKRVRLRPARLTIQGVDVGGQEIVFDFNHASGLPAFAVSEGTLVTLALLTAIHTGPRPRLVLIDDIEQSLHPAAQMELVRQLKGVLAQTPDLQIVATTHSPYVLEGVDASEVRVLFPREDGRIVVRPLSEHPDAERVKGTLSPGQLWSLDPEDWVLRGETSA